MATTMADLQKELDELKEQLKTVSTRGRQSPERRERMRSIRGLTPNGNWVEVTDPNEETINRFRNGAYTKVVENTN